MSSLMHPPQPRPFRLVHHFAHRPTPLLMSK
jgi:hypothetical protein